MAAYAAHTTNYLSTHLLTTETNKKARATSQKILPFRKWRFREKEEVRRMGQKQKARFFLGVSVTAILVHVSAMCESVQAADDVFHDLKHCPGDFLAPQ